MCPNCVCLFVHCCATTLLPQHRSWGAETATDVVFHQTTLRRTAAKTKSRTETAKKRERLNIFELWCNNETMRTILTGNVAVLAVVCHLKVRFFTPGVSPTLSCLNKTKDVEILNFHICQSKESWFGLLLPIWNGWYLTLRTNLVIVSKSSVSSLHTV